MKLETAKQHNMKLTGESENLSDKSTKPQLVKPEEQAIAKTIYDLDLHEEMKIGNMNILRVPGGWIYTVNYQLNFKVGLQNGTQVFMTSTFVPQMGWMYPEKTFADKQIGK